MPVNLPKPVWLGMTVYLVTIGDIYAFHGEWADALVDFGKSYDPDEPCAIWECQMGYDPKDVTPKARVAA